MQLKEQPGLLKSNILRPFSSGPSAFRPWRPSLKSGLGEVEASDGVVKANPQDNNNNNMGKEKSNLGHVEKNQINVGSATVGADVDDQAQHKMDPKRLKQILAHRAAEKKFRTRKNEYMAHLERMDKYYQDTLYSLHSQMEACKNKRWLMQIEHHQLKLEIAVHEKKAILREVEIERNQAELNRLMMELQKKQG
ncbi:hypothetical protein L195_g017770 [Trifolium pratense]|uniref:BZIP domain-containing protein n=1 Tax=Trifolium pratense TaxID=57577 RepID=A0A2K3MUT1_TRIPR|nr:hypothetical protein L195_g017770 [Trifolium pratense]